MSMSTSWAIKTLTRSHRKSVSLLVIAQIFVQSMDIVGLLLFTTLVMSFIAQINNSPLPSLVNRILDYSPWNMSTNEALFILAILAVLFLLSKSVLSIVILILTQRFLIKRENHESTRYISEVFKSPWLNLRSMNPSNIFFIFTSGTQVLFNSGYAALFTIATESLFQIMVLTTMLFVSPSLTAISILMFAGLGFFLFRIQGKYAQDIGRVRSQSSTRLNLEIYTSHLGFRNLYVANQVHRKIANLLGERSLLSSMQAREVIIGQLSKYAVDIFTILLMICLCFLTIFNDNKVQAAGILTFFVAATTRIVPSILRIQNGLFSLKLALASIKSIDPASLEFLSNSKPKKRKSNEEHAENNLGGVNQYQSVNAVEIKNMSFKYPDSIHYQLHSLNLKIKQGEKIGIIGASGSGKSTLADLLVGLFKPVSGSVRIFGVEPELFIKSHEQGSFGYVPQDVPIFPESIYENLVLGDHSISREKVMDVLGILNLGGLVSEMEDGLDSMLGTQGRVISGGQRQRLGIARAILRQPKLLILDEATSSLDYENEKSVKDTYEDGLTDITTIVIAHKESAIDNLDRILKLEHGKIVFEGTFQEYKQEMPNAYE